MINIAAHKNPNKIDDKTLITLTCPDCGKEFQLSYGRYRRFCKDPEHVFRCQPCYLIYQGKVEKERYATMSKEEQDAFQKKCYDARQNRSDEKKAITAHKTSEIMKEFWANKDEEYRKQHGQKNKDAWAAKSDEYKLEWSRRISENQKKAWALLTYEERIEKMKPLFEGSNKFWSQISDDDKNAIYKHLGELHKEYFRNLSKEEYDDWRAKLSKSHKDYWNSMSNDQKQAWMRKIWDRRPGEGSTSFDFLNDLNNMGLVCKIDYDREFSTEDCESGPFEHPDFRKVFGYVNPITGGEIFPYHYWDFIIYTKEDHDNILVDIDGSLHNPKLMNFKRLDHAYTERQMIDFNDIQRPWQVPDGYSAYIIECHTNILGLDSKVIKLKPGTKEADSAITYGEFKELIRSETSDV